MFPPSLVFDPRERRLSRRLNEEFDMQGSVVLRGAFGALLMLLAAAAAAQLDVGDQAPDFELQASDGKTYRLSLAPKSSWRF